MASARRVGTNENIQTYGDGTRDYTSLATWESATDNDLVTATTSEVLECYADSPSFADDVNLFGATTNASFFRIIRPAVGEGHDGTPNSGVVFTTTTANSIISCSEDHDLAQDLVLRSTTNQVGGTNCVGINSGVNDVEIVGCLLKATNSGTGSGRGFTSFGAATNYVIDCVAYKCDNSGFFVATPSTVVFYNCTAVDCGTGFNRQSGTATAKNCLASGNTTADFSGTFAAASIANASSDGTAPGASPALNRTFVFADPDNDDYHLLHTDRGAFQRGVDLSADATFAFDDDIDGDTITIWSIGADAQASVISARRAGVGEVISTYGDGTRDYTSLLTWESDTDNDLVTAQISEVLEVYADSSEFNDNTSMSGATTNASYLRLIRPAAGHGHLGAPNTGVRFIRTTNGTAFDLNEANAQVQDLDVETSAAAIGNSIGISLRQTNTLAVGCLVKSTNTGSGGAWAIAASPTGTAYIIDCVAYESKSRNLYCLAAGTTLYLYNCTAVGGAANGFERFAGTVIAKNCLASGNATDFSGTFDAASEANASSDATAPGGGEVTNRTFTFVDIPTDNYHLADTDIGALQRGLNLSADANFPFEDDLDTEVVLVWSIGADAQASCISARRPGVGEVISTYGDGTRDYTSLSNWEVATDNDLVTAKNSEVLECYADSAQFDDSMSFSGAVTDVNYRRIVRAAPGQGHGGTPNAGVQFRITAGSSVFNLNEAYDGVYDIVASINVSSASNIRAFLSSAGDNHRFVGCIAHDATNPGAAAAHGFVATLNSPRSLVLVDCAAIDCDNKGFRCNQSTVTMTCYNCTAVGCDMGFEQDAGDMRTINCLADGNTTNDFGAGLAESSFCASGDSTAQGAGSRIDQTFVFVDPTNDDYRLGLEDEAALGFGTDLSDDPIFPFNDDAEGNKVLTWSIGFDSDSQTLTGGARGSLLLLRRWFRG